MEVLAGSSRLPLMRTWYGISENGVQPCDDVAIVAKVELGVAAP